MKKLFLFLLVSGLTTFLLSCNKSNGFGVKQVVIDTTISSGVLYTLNLKPYGNSGRIITQAASYSTSQIIGNARASSLVYQYSSAVKGGTIDQVVLGVSGAGNSNGCANPDSTVIKVNLTVK